MLDLSRWKPSFVICSSCGEECDATAPEEGEFVCEDCVG